MESAEYRNHRIYYQWVPAHDAPGKFTPVAFIRGPFVRTPDDEPVYVSDRRCETQNEAKAIALEAAKVWILKQEVIKQLQHQYRSSGNNDPVEWKSLAPGLDVTVDELSVAINELCHASGGQIDIKPVDSPDFIKLGPRALAAVNPKP